MALSSAFSSDRDGTLSSHRMARPQAIGIPEMAAGLLAGAGNTAFRGTAFIHTHKSADGTTERLEYLNVTSIASGPDYTHSNLQAGSGSGSGSESGFHHSFSDPTEFVPSRQALGLDFGLQIAQPHFRLHRKTHDKHGLMVYEQSDRGKSGQSVYHVVTLGRGSSVHKCVALLFNDKAGFEVAKKDWPDPVHMEDFRNEVVRHLPGYEFARCKIRKGRCTFYLYCVKKEDAEFLHGRKQCWDHLQTTIARMDEVTDWSSLRSWG